jgi:hypothetical protein
MTIAGTSIQRCWWNVFSLCAICIGCGNSNFSSQTPSVRSVSSIQRPQDYEKSVHQLTRDIAGNEDQALALYSTTKNPLLRTALAEALANCESKSIDRFISNSLDSVVRDKVLLALDILRWMPKQRLSGHLDKVKLVATNNQQSEIKLLAVAVLIKTREPKYNELYSSCIKAANSIDKEKLILIAVGSGNPDLIPILAGCLKDPDEEQRLIAIETMLLLDRKKALAALSRYTDSSIRVNQILKAYRQKQ